MRIFINKRGYLEGRYKNVILVYPPNYPESKMRINLMASYNKYLKHGRISNN